MNASRRFLSGASILTRSFSAMPKRAPPPHQAERLYRRLSALKIEKGKVASTINEYIREGNTVSKLELDICIKQLRKYKRFHQALEIMEWMEFRKINFRRLDYGVRLELIGKVKGIAEAENYFRDVEQFSVTYLALLSCYCDEKMTDKALDLFADMVKANMVSRPHPFNKIMSLYNGLKQPEKAIALGEEMKKMDIEPDTFSYNLLIRSYSDLNDIEGAERVFEEMKQKHGKWCNWTTYSNLANLYIRGGQREKAEMALKELEKELDPKDRLAYHFLISLYAEMSDIQNVQRVWKSLKLTFEFMANMSYLVMLQALKKLGDINGMAEIYKEWEYVYTTYDVRLTNTVISAYLKHEMPQDAMLILENALNKTNRPLFSSWEMFMNFFLGKHQIKKALEIMEAAASRVNQDYEWFPRSDVIDGFLNYFKVENDVNSAEEFYKLMKKIDCVDASIYEALLETYVGAGITVPDMRARIEGDGIKISSKLDNLIKSVCPE